MAEEATNPNILDYKEIKEDDVKGIVVVEDGKDSN